MTWGLGAIASVIALLLCIGVLSWRISTDPVYQRTGEGKRYGTVYSVIVVVIVLSVVALAVSLVGMLCSEISSTIW